MIQTILVILAIAGATFYVGLIVYKKFFRKNTECDNCSMGKAAEK